MLDLAFISNEDLIKEILNRFDHGIISLLQIKNITLGELTVTHYWKGNSYTCAGLAEDLKIKILNKFNHSQDFYKFN